MKKPRASLEPFWDLKVSKYVEYLTHVQGLFQDFAPGGGQMLSTQILGGASGKNQYSACVSTPI